MTPSTATTRAPVADETTGRVRVDDVFPYAALPGASGALVPVVGARPTVVVFFHGAWCPPCGDDLGAYQRTVLPHLLGRGALVAVSPQGRTGTAASQRDHSLALTVLSDRWSDLSRTLGLTVELTPEQRRGHVVRGHDLGEADGDGTWALPRPTVVVVDDDRIVTFVDVQPDHARRARAGAVVEAVRALPEP